MSDFQDDFQFELQVEVEQELQIKSTARDATIITVACTFPLVM
jgi:hypothetical protein